MSDRFLLRLALTMGLLVSEAQMVALGGSLRGESVFLHLDRELAHERTAAFL